MNLVLKERIQKLPLPILLTCEKCAQEAKYYDATESGSERWFRGLADSVIPYLKSNECSFPHDTDTLSICIFINNISEEIHSAYDERKHDLVS